MKQNDSNEIKKIIYNVKELEEFAKWRLEQVKNKISPDGENLETELRKIKVKDWKNQRHGIVETKSIRMELEEQVRRWREAEKK